VLHHFSWLLGCLSELSDYKDQLNTSYPLSRHDGFNVLTQNLFVFIRTRTHACD